MLDLVAFKAWLQDEGITTPISYDEQPEDPTNHYLLRATGGFGTTMEDAFDRPSFQVLIRGSSGEVAYTLAKTFDDLMLSDEARNFALGDAWVLKIARIGGGPTYLGLDNPERNRPEYSSNYFLEISRG